MSSEQQEGDGRAPVAVVTGAARGIGQSAWRLRFLSDPVEFRPGVWVVYFLGPDGEVVELRRDGADVVGWRGTAPTWW